MLKSLFLISAIFASQTALSASYTITLMNENVEPIEARIATNYTANKNSLFCKSINFENGGFTANTYNITQTVMVDQQGRIAFTVFDQIDKCHAKRNSEPSIQLKLSDTLYDDEASVKTRAGAIEIVTDNSFNEMSIQKVECKNVTLSSQEKVISCSGARIKVGRSGSALVNLVIREN